MTKRQTDYGTFEGSSTKHRRLLRQEELIIEVTEALAGALENEGITRAELATRLGKSRAFVSQVLAGGRNLTLRTVADVADALRCRIRVRACPEKREPVQLTTHEMGAWEIEEGLVAWSGKVVIGAFGEPGARYVA